ncbi:MAG: DUF4350 domain-containing protein, partial [Planctomycetes bacterium]|nr:DUF4350 domain-containing protein [Planctomycetota bacterium]
PMHCKKANRLFTVFLLTTTLIYCRESGDSVEPPRTADPSFYPEIRHPAFEQGKGPKVLIDEAHNNFHTAEGTYKPFASLLERDGYRMERGRARFDKHLLEPCRILVISDPMLLKDESPPYSDAEVKIVHAWVRKGGSLFLITDHFPDPPAIEKLAAAFGVTLNNGYVMNGYPDAKEKPLLFERAKETLGEHAVTNGIKEGEKIETVATFCGTAFKAGPDFTPILIFEPGKKSWMPEKPYDFKPDTPVEDVGGWYQGAVAECGQGKVAVFSEAAMFTAQLFDNGRVPVGMNHPLAEDNVQLLLNLIHWLSEAPVDQEKE